MRMKVLLINPLTPLMIPNRDYYIPSGLLYIASVLRKADVEVNILDLNIYKPERHDVPMKFCEGIIIDRISDFQPSFIGLGCLFSGQFPSVQFFSKKIKETFKNIPIVIGGLHPTIYPAEILTHCSYIDFIVIGEGEESILHLVNMFKSGCRDFDKIDGFAYRKNGEVIVNPKKHFISNPDNIAFPAYELIKLTDYYRDTSDWNNPRNLPINMSIPIISSRSCPMRCNFCPAFLVMGPKWRSRSPKNLVEEIEFLYKKYGHRHFSFMDDNLTLDKTRMLEICNEIISRKLNIQFETPNGIAVQTLDEEALAALMEAGLVRLSLAIESGSDFIRNQVMGKRLSKDKLFEIIWLTKKYKDLYVLAFFIIGMPEDTRETLEETYKMVKDIDVNKPIVSNVMPFPGTRLFDQVLKDDLLVDKLNQNELWNMDDIYSGASNKRFFIKPYNLELSELQEFRERIGILVKDIIDKKEKIWRENKKKF